MEKTLEQIRKRRKGVDERTFQIEKRINKTSMAEILKWRTIRNR